MLGRITFVAARRSGGQADAAVAHRVVAVDMAPMPQASTQLRTALANGQGIAQQTAPAVAYYIARHGLYSSAQAG
jgi:nicotinic acid mononucleotide adenylyltransferase